MLELCIIICRILFLLFVFYFLYQGVVYILAQRGIIGSEYADSASGQQLGIILLNHIMGFSIILAKRYDTEAFADILLVFAAGLIVFVTARLILHKVYKGSCPCLFNGIFFLMDLSLIMLSRLAPDLALRQLYMIAGGFILMMFIPFVMKLLSEPEKYKYLYLIIGGAFLLSPFLLGETRGGATNWIVIGIKGFSFSFQPSEVVKFFLVFYLASVFSKERKIYQLILPAGAAAALILILVLQKDLGGALIFFMTFMVMLYIATGNLALFIAGFAMFGAASVVAYNLFPHVQVRVTAWIDPWPVIDKEGHQIIQALFAMGTWGPLGSGLTRGVPGYVPVSESDFIFAAICEEFGVIFGLGVIAVFIMIFFRGVNISLRSEKRFLCMLSAGLTAILCFQSFLIIGGNINLIPLTGVTLPFVSYGGSSVVVSMLMVGILQWVSVENSKS